MGATVIVLSGGNVDPARLLEIVRRHETHAGRRLRLYSAIRDRPGALAGLLVAVGEAGANVIDVTHVRDGVDLHFGQTGIELVAGDPRHGARRRRRRASHSRRI